MFISSSPHYCSSRFFIAWLCVCIEDLSLLYLDDWHNSNFPSFQAPTTIRAPAMTRPSMPPPRPTCSQRRPDSRTPGWTRNRVRFWFFVEMPFPFSETKFPPFSLYIGLKVVFCGRVCFPLDIWTYALFQPTPETRAREATRAMARAPSPPSASMAPAAEITLLRLRIATFNSFTARWGVTKPKVIG